MFNSFHHTVPIWNFDPKPPVLEGTGIFVGVDQHRYVVTAAHVLQNSNGKPVFGSLSNDGNLNLFGEKKPLILMAVDQTGKGDPATAEYANRLDLGIICLRPQARAWLEERYTPFDFPTNNAPLNPGMCFISGWPEKKNQFNPHRKTAQLGSKPGCYHIQAPAAPAERVIEIGGIPDVHFALEMNLRKDFYDQRTRQRITLFRPEGLSGSGVWNMNPDDGDSMPLCAQSLAGILIEYDDKKHMALVIREKYIWPPLLQAITGEASFSPSRPLTAPPS